VLGLGGDLSLTVSVVLLVIAALVFEAAAADVSLGAGVQLQFAELVRGRRRTRERVILLGGQQVPEQDGQLACYRDDRDRLAPAGADALVSYLGLDPKVRQPTGNLLDQKSRWCPTVSRSDARKAPSGSAGQSLQVTHPSRRVRQPATIEDVPSTRPDEGISLARPVPRAL